MRCLGFDIGSTSLKGAILDLEHGTVAGMVRREFPAPVAGQPAGHFEVDLAEILSRVESMLAELASTAPDAQALFCSGQMGGLVLVDEAGHPLTRYLSWRDQRTLQPSVSGASYLSEISQRWSSDLFQELGRELKPGSTASLLYWLAQNGQLPPGAQPVTVADYVLGRLCGCLAPMDPTHALGLLNLTTASWHTTALAALELNSIRWPRLALAKEPLGEARWPAGKLVCYPSVGDQPCALRGVDLQRGELSLNVSTGAQVSCRTASFEPGPYQTRMYFGGEFLNTITHLPAGRSLNVIVDLLTELARAQGVELTGVWGTLSTLAEKATDSNLEVDLAFFSGPMGDEGSIRKITTDNLTVGQLLRAAFRNMTQNFVASAGQLRSTGDWSRLVLSGGMTQSVPLLRQMIEASFDLPYREARTEEETLAGLLKIATTYLD